MTAPQAVFTATTAVVVVAIAAVTSGVALLAGVGWALITAGGLSGLCAVGAAVVLLRDGTSP